MYGAPGGYRVDVNSNGIPDYKVGPYGQVRPDIEDFVPPNLYGGMGCRFWARVDVNGDGILDVRVGLYRQMRPDIAQYVHSIPI